MSSPKSLGDFDVVCGPAPGRQAIPAAPPRPDAPPAGRAPKVSATGDGEKPPAE